MGRRQNEKGGPRVTTSFCEAKTRSLGTLGDYFFDFAVAGTRNLSVLFLIELYQSLDTLQENKYNTKIHAICLNRVIITPGGKLAYVNNNNNKNGQRINEMIRVREVRLIDDEGNQLGIVATQEALRMANDKD